MGSGQPPWAAGELAIPGEHILCPVLLRLFMTFAELFAMATGVKQRVYQI